MKLLIFVAFLVGCSTAPEPKPVKSLDDKILEGITLFRSSGDESRLKRESKIYDCYQVLKKAETDNVSYREYRFIYSDLIKCPYDLEYEDLSNRRVAALRRMEALEKQYAVSSRACDENIRWGYELGPKNCVYCAISIEPKLEKLKGSFLTKEECELNRVQDSEASNNRDKCFSRYIGKKVDRDFWLADYMVLVRDSAHKKAMHFANEENCKVAVENGAIEIGLDSATEVWPLSKNEKTRFINGCYKKAITMCDSNWAQSLRIPVAE